MNFSWEKIHFDQWLRDSRYPEGRWRSFLSLVSSPPCPLPGLCAPAWPVESSCSSRPMSSDTGTLPQGWLKTCLSHSPHGCSLPLLWLPEMAVKCWGPTTRLWPPDFMIAPPPREWQANSSGGIHRYSCAPLAHTWAGSWGRGAGCWKGHVPHRLTVFPSSTSWWHLSWGF